MQISQTSTSSILKDKPTKSESESLEGGEIDEIEPLVRLWVKLGNYFSMDYLTMMKQPWWALKQAAAVIDEKEGDMAQFVNFEESAMYKNLKRMLGTKESS